MIYFNMMDLRDVPDQKGQAHFVAKCSFCKESQSILFIDNSNKSYTDENEQYQTVARFECRYAHIILTNCLI